MAKTLKNKSILVPLGIALGLTIVLVTALVMFSSSSSGPVALTYWGVNQPKEVIEPLIAQFERANPTITIQYQEQTLTDYRERLQNSIAGGTGPDIFRIHNTWTPYFKSQLSQAPEEIFSAAAYSQIFYPSASSWGIQNQKVVAVPLMYDGLGLYINPKILQGASVRTPTTWEEVSQAARRLTITINEEIQRGGIALGTTTNVDFWPDIIALLLMQNGADIAKPNSQEAADAIAFYKQFAQDGGTWSSALPDSTYAFATEKVAMMLAPASAAHQVHSINPDLEFTIAPAPTIPQVSANWASFWVESVNKNSSRSEREAAWKFLAFLSQKENLRLRHDLTASLPDRLFGEIFPRTDMSDQITADRYTGAYVDAAPNAKSWFLASNTNDNALNDQIIELYKQVLDSRRPESELTDLQSQITKVLSPYTSR